VVVERAVKSVAEVLMSKSDQTVHTIAPSATVFDALKRMAEKRIGALVVIEEGSIVGMITERDYARKIILMGRSSRETPVREVMTSPVLYVRKSHTNEECMALMTENRLRHLPVLEDGKLIGIVSIGDLVKDIIGEQRFIIEQLEHYIMGDRAA
jgi:CBS domain-containing protein